MKSTAEEFDHEGMLGESIRRMIRERNPYVLCYVAGLYNEVTCPYKPRLDTDHDYCNRVARLLRKWRRRYRLAIEESDSSGRWISRL